MPKFFFAKVKVGTDVLVTIDLLFKNIDVGPLIGTTIILNLYLRTLVSSINFRIATIYNPNVLESKVFCLVLYHIIRAL